MATGHVLGRSSYGKQAAAALGYEHANFTLLYCSKQQGVGAYGTLSSSVWSHVANRSNTLTVAQSADGRGSIGGFLAVPWPEQNMFIEDVNARVFRFPKGNSTAVVGVRYKYRRQAAMFSSNRYGPIFGGVSLAYPDCRHCVPAAMLLPNCPGGKPSKLGKKRSKAQKDRSHSKGHRGFPYGYKSPGASFSQTYAVTGHVSSRKELIKGFANKEQAAWLQVWEVKQADPVVKLVGPLWRPACAFNKRAAARQLQAVAAFSLPAPLKRANILLLGPAGAGKSSLVSTLDGLMRGAITRRADYGGASTSLTLALRRYTFPTASHGGPAAAEAASASEGGLPVALWDTRGWCPASYHSGELGMMLEGHLPHRTDLSGALGPTSTPCYVATPSLAQRMHCLVMCIAAPSATDPTCTSRIKELKRIATSRGLRVLVALTKIDEYDPALAADLQQLSASSLIANLLAQLSQASGIAPNNIFPVKNFCTEYHPDDSPAVGPLLLSLLHHALLCSQTYLEEECGLGDSRGRE